MIASKRNTNILQLFQLKRHGDAHTHGFTEYNFNTMSRYMKDVLLKNCGVNQI